MGGSKWLNFCWLNSKGCQLWAPLSLTFLHQFWKFLCLPCCKFPEFFKTPPTFFIGMVLKAVMDKIPKKSEIRKYAILSQPINLTFLEDEIFQLFSYLYGSKVPKWNFAHILLWKKAKKIRKTPKNTWFTAPWLRTTLLNDPVCTNN